MNVLRYLFFWEWFKRWRHHRSLAPCNQTICPAIDRARELAKTEKTAAQLVEELAYAIPEKPSVAESDEVWKAWNQ